VRGRDQNLNPRLQCLTIVDVLLVAAISRRTAQRKRLCPAISRNQNIGKKTLKMRVIRVIID
jgi:hypothetical protein